MKRMLLTAGMTLAAMTWMAAAAMAQSPNEISWSGWVDNTITISFHGSEAVVNVLNGHDVKNMRYEIRQPVPDTPVEVELADTQGRGTIELLHEPHDRNNDTVTVRITDPQPGSGYYHFDLRW